jgi:hypothetical protein
MFSTGRAGRLVGVPMGKRSSQEESLARDPVATKPPLHYTGGQPGAAPATTEKLKAEWPSTLDSYPNDSCFSVGWPEDARSD